jgi:hypothetical protein
MKNRVLIYSAVMLVWVSMVGCSVVPQIRGNGVKVAEERAVAEFHRLSIAGSGRAIITQGTRESLEVEADENLLPYIEAEVRGGELHIGMRGNLSFTEGPVFRIGVRSLNRLHLAGSLRAEVDRLDTERFDVGVSGSGDVEVGYLDAVEVELSVSGSGRIELRDGQVSELDMRISGSGDLQAEQLEVERAEVSISGSGNARLWVKESLKAHVSGSGDIRYRGNPGEVSSSVSGSGKVRSVER